MANRRGRASVFRRGAVAILVALAILASGRADAATRLGELFGPTVPEHVPATADADPAAHWTVRSRTVRPDLAAARAAAEAFGVTGSARVQLDLFAALDLDAEVVAVDTRPNGVTLYLRLDGVELGSAVVTLVDDYLHAYVMFPGGNFSVLPHATGTHRVAQVAQHLLPLEGPPQLVPASAAPDVPPAPDPPADSGRLIDVMVVWTPAAAIYAGADAVLAARAQAQLDVTNLVYLNSGVAQRVRLVHTEQVNYVDRSETGICYPSLCALRDLTGTGDGYMDHVHALRDAHGADLVFLFHRDPTTPLQLCGQAWMPTPPSPLTNAYGFGVVEVSCTIEGTTTPHELGHNMGANHDPYVLSTVPAHGCPDGKERGAFCYSRGMVSVAGDWRTIMSYPHECMAGGRPWPYCTKLPFVSNPKLSAAGLALGTAATNNNALTLNRTAKLIAGYRPTAPIHPVPPRFADVSAAHPFFGYVQFFGQSGITNGCGEASFCPDAPVTREAMAAFIMRGVKASNWAPPPPDGEFVDVPANAPFAGWIEALRAEGITSGCSFNLYCPSAAVTRAQMAVFLLRARCGATYSPTSPAVATFADVATSHPFFGFIEKLHALGVTGGCATGPLRYCPDASVTRGQMAVFVERSYPFLVPSEACAP